MFHWWSNINAIIKNEILLHGPFGDMTLLDVFYSEICLYKKGTG